MTGNHIKNIPTGQIDFDSQIARALLDPFDLFVYCQQVALSGKAQPLVVRKAVQPDNYIIVCNATTYTNEGMLLQAARKIGMNEVPCIVIDEDPDLPDAGPDRPQEPLLSPIEPIATSSLPEEAISEVSISQKELQPVLHDLLATVTAMAHEIAKRSSGNASRITGPDDWAQEATIALWQMHPDHLEEVQFRRRYVYAILHNLAAQGAKLVRRTASLSHEVAAPASLPAETQKSVQTLERQVCKLVPIIYHELYRAIGAAEGRLAKALFAWLEGRGYKAAGESSGLTLYDVRKGVAQLKRRPRLKKFLNLLLTKLHAIHSECPAAVSRIDLGPWVPRLLRGHAGQRRKA
jgi:hypothetical protein